MTDLPPSWEWTTLGDVAEISGGIQKQPKRAPVSNAYPFLRVANVLRGKLDLDEVHRIELFDGELDRYALRRNDLLVVEGNGSPDQIGRAALWSGAIADCVHQNHLIRVRSRGIDPDYLSLVWNSQMVRDQLLAVAGSTSGLYTLSTRKLAYVTFAMPPLAEQRRIATVSNELLDATTRAATAVSRASNALVRFKRASSERLLEQARGSRSGPLIQFCSSVTDGDHQAPPKRETGVPFLVIGDVKKGALDFADTRSVDPSYYDSLDDRRKPRRGDVLYTLVGSFGFALPVETDQPFCVQRHIGILRPREGVHPRYLAAVLNTSSAYDQAARAATGTAQLTVPLRGLRNLTVELPDLDEQIAVLDSIDQVATVRDTLQREIDVAFRRASTLSGSIIRAACAGTLGTSHPDDEPASALLERIRSEWATGTPSRTRSRTTTSQPSTTLAYPRS